MTTPQPLDILAHLDWSEIACQNPRRQCPHPATWLTETHAIDCCNDTNNPFGNITELLCNTCLTELRREVDDHINQLPKPPAIPACFTCGAPIREPSDILRTVKAIA